MKKAKLIGISILGIWFACFNLTQAQNVFRTTTKSVIAFYESVPQDYNSNSDKYPVVIFLHGVGERGPNTTDIATLKAGISPVAKLGPPMQVKNGKTFPFILISPQLKNNLTYWNSSYVFEVLDYVKTYLRIDERRIHITGLSMGGHAAWNLCESFPGMWASGGPVCGFSNTPSKACNIASENLPIWAFHGAIDTTVPLDKSQRMVDAINACLPAPNPLAKLTIYPNVKHEAWTGAYSYDHAYQTPNYYEWLVTFTNKVNSGNTIPIANAGSDKSVTLPNPLTLTGSGSDTDGTIASYKWAQFTGPSSATLTNITSAALTVSNLAVGTYTFGLQVKDNGGQTDTDYVKVTVLSGTGNAPPVADAGVDKIIVLPATSTSLTGSATDSDGTIASYAWTKTSGGAATLSGTTTTTLGLSGLAGGVYVFRLTVKDNTGATHYDEVNLTVNNSPSANAGVDKSITLPTTSTTITGSGTDTDGTIASYTWSKVSGGAATLGSTTSTTLSVSGLVAGTYVFRLGVKDNLGATDSNDMTLVVNAAATNVAPVANAGTDKVITSPTSSVSITGSATDSDGTIASYLWTKVSGGTATLSGTTTTTLSLTSLVAGVYTFRFTATDNGGGTHYDDVKVTVNVVPTVSAGADVSIVLPVNSVALQGTATDTDGTIASYAWTKTSGGAATLNNATTSLVTVTGMVEGVYTFRLTVKDNYGATSTDDVVVNVLAAVQGKPVNTAPVANAGTDKTLVLPVNSVSLTGSATDADGTIATYAWTKISGGTATLTNANTNKVTLTGLVSGSYVFRLTVTDNAGATHYDDANVVVNNAPLADAGSDKTLTLPTNSVSLTGSGTDSDGIISAYEWTKISGGAATLANANTNKVSLSGLVAGAYVFRLTVTDNLGATHFDDADVLVTVVVANNAPVANAGTDKTLTLPTNSVSLTGSGTDSDGTISTYAWTKISGGAATLTNANTNKVSLSGLVAGAYVFRLTVTDNLGSTHSDDADVFVNVAPIANAGSDKNVSLASATTTLTGSGSDTDGSISSYAWTKISGGAVALAGASTNTLALTSLVQGAYVFRLTVTDNHGATAYDEVTVTVAPNVAPSSHAGTDREITLPTNSLIISGTGEDTDGTIATYIWTKLSGGAATLSDANTSNLTVTGLQAGEYVFRLRVVDNDGASDSNDMILTVIPNTAPMVNAGVDQLIKLPATTATLGANGTDADGTISGYSWTKISGGAATLTNALTKTLLLSALVEGTYVFRVQATDNAGASATDDVTVTVAPNVAPSSHAGADREITLPTNSIVISGSAGDSDGTIASYTWTKLSGGAATLSGTATPTLTVTGLVAGTYIFRLRAVDNDGDSDSNDMILTVKSAGSSARMAFDEDAIPESALPSSGDEGAELIADDFTHFNHSEWKNKYVIMYDANGNRIHQGEWTSDASEKMSQLKGLFIYHILREGKSLRQGKLFFTNTMN